mmetsp:Transcript_25522/g.19288  ORF Transcript_25522/g.19288 Transcript_25522/m.19288 type:complete len:136 (+) Transcript_25522:2074-2481(+)
MFEKIKQYRPTVPKTYKPERREDHVKVCSVNLILTCYRLYFQFLISDDQAKIKTKDLLIRYFRKDKIEKPWHLTISKILFDVKHFSTEEIDDNQQVQNLLDLRAVIKNNFGELGDRMSENAYEISKLLTELWTKS